MRTQSFLPLLSHKETVCYSKHMFLTKDQNLYYSGVQESADFSCFSFLLHFELDSKVRVAHHITFRFKMYFVVFVA